MNTREVRPFIGAHSDRALHNVHAAVLLRSEFRSGSRDDPGVHGFDQNRHILSGRNKDLPDFGRCEGLHVASGSGLDDAGVLNPATTGADVQGAVFVVPLVGFCALGLAVDLIVIALWSFFKW